MVSCAKMAELFKMQFGLWARMGSRNHMLDGSLEVLRDIAIATNFGTQFARLTGFFCPSMGYNFGCTV